MKKTVCVDLDGTLLRYDGWKGVDHLGEPLPGAVEFTKALSEFADVVIWTTRCNPEMNKPESAHLLRNRVRDHLDKHGFSYVEIFIGTAKPISSAFIDDRAVRCVPQERPGEYGRALEQARALCNDGIGRGVYHMPYEDLEELIVEEIRLRGIAERKVRHYEQREQLLYTLMAEATEPKLENRRLKDELEKLKAERPGTRPGAAPDTEAAGLGTPPEVPVRNTPGSDGPERRPTEVANPPPPPLRETWRGRPIQRLDDPNVDFPLPPEPGWEKEL